MSYAPVIGILAVLGAVVAVRTAKARSSSSGPQPASGLQGTPVESVEQAGVHQYVVQRWPVQPDGLSYAFVKFKDAPGAHGVTFSEGPGPGQQVQRKLVHAFGPTEVTNVIRAEWLIQA